MAITAVAGMGGIGKTALAQQYVRTAKAQYPGGRWYFKLREQSLVTQLVSAAAIYGWELPDSLTDDRARARWCYTRWGSQFPGQRLLLLDDVQQYEDVRDFLPNNARVLMTSRQRFGSPVDRLDLGELPLAEALELLTRLIGNGDRVSQQQTEAAALCEWVGRLPLGVELIARYLALHPNLSFTKLQQRLEQQRLKARALRQAPEEIAYDQLEDYEQPIEAAFELSWQDLTPEAKTLMGLLSIFAAAPILQGLIVEALPGWDEEDLEEGLDAILVQRNLVQSDEDGSYQLHQLIREFTTIKLDTELSEQTPALQKGVADSLTDVAKQIRQIVTVSAQQAVSDVIPHMALVARELTHRIEDSTDAIWPFVGLGRFYQSQSLWPEAEHWWQACLEMTEKRFGSDHPDTATSLNNLAGWHYAMGHYSQAERMYLRSLEIKQKVLPPEHPSMQRGIDNFQYFVQQVFETNQTTQLSDHPLTQAILENLQSPQGVDE